MPHPRRLKPWQWELVRDRAGPDHALWMRFDEASPGRLQEVFDRTDLPGFAEHRHRDGAGEPRVTYINASRSAAFARNLAGRDITNIWTYRTMVVAGPTLLFENGYGDEDPDDLRTQSELLRRLSVAPGVTLVEWKIAASDTGILLKSVAEGHTADELLEHLRGE